MLGLLHFNECIQEFSKKVNLKNIRYFEVKETPLR